MRRVPKFDGMNVKVEKLRAAFKGKRLSKETIEKRTASRAGYKHSEDTIRKISISRIGKQWVKDNAKKMGLDNKGRKRSLEERKVIKENNLRKWRNPIFREKMLLYHSSEEGRENLRKGFLAQASKMESRHFSNTKPELEMCKYLSELGFEYRHSYIVRNIKHGYPADFIYLDLILS